MQKSGIYIHIPYCKAKCAYCSFVSGIDFSSQRDYVDRLKQEISTRAAGEQCDTVFFGGGTPSVLYRGAITEIMDTIRRCFLLQNDCEVTVEANPESCSVAFLDECRAAGANRLSLGLQSCDNTILKAAGRLHTYAKGVAAVERARARGFSNINIDLIMGLPHETEDTFLRSLEKLIALSPQHISVYALKCEEGTSLCDSGYHPDDDFVASLYQKALEILQACGYLRYEVSNFCKKGNESKHNNKYWSMVPYLGFGVAAHSYYDRGQKSYRRANTSSLEKYLLGEFCDYEQDVTQDRREEFIMLGLRKSEGISLTQYANLFLEDFFVRYGNRAQQLMQKGLLIQKGDRLSISPSHMYVMNSIVCSLLND